MGAYGGSGTFIPDNVTLKINGSGNAYVDISTMVDGTTLTASANKALIKAGGVGSAQLAAGAFTQVIVQRFTTAVSTTSTTLVDVTGINATINSTGGKTTIIELTAKTLFTGTGSYNQWALLEDGVIIENSYDSPINTTNNEQLVIRSVRTPAAGSHTYKLQASRDSGAAVFNTQANGTSMAELTITEYKA